MQLREKRKAPKEERLDDTPYDAERKDISGFDGPLTPTDSVVSKLFIYHMNIVDMALTVIIELINPSDLFQINANTSGVYLKNASMTNYEQPCGCLTYQGYYT